MVFEKSEIVSFIHELQQEKCSCCYLLFNILTSKLYCVDDLQSAVGQSIYGEVQNVFCDFLPWHRDYLPVLISGSLNKANIAISISSCRGVVSSIDG